MLQQGILGNVIFFLPYIVPSLVVLFMYHEWLGLEGIRWDSLCKSTWGLARVRRLRLLVLAN